MKFDVVGFGALNIDKLYRVDRIARSGEERFITGYSKTPGGSAANTIVGLARLGNKVGQIGKIGKDLEGKTLLNSLKNERVDTKGIRISKEGRSGVAIGFVDNRGERTLYINPSVNDIIYLDDIDKEYLHYTKFLHMTSFVSETSFETQKKLIQNIPDIKLSFDPGELYVRKGLSTLKPILKRCFVIFPNENELKLLTRAELVEGAKTLIKEGVKIVAVKLGARGCYVTDGEESFQIEPPTVKVLDTTGAGDAFCAGFLHGLLSGENLHRCGRIANFVATCKIEKVGAREGLPNQSDLLKI